MPILKPTNEFRYREATDDELITMEWNTPDESNAREYIVERSTDGGQTFAPSIPRKPLVLNRCTSLPTNVPKQLPSTALL